jgi:hypothetical protein
VLGSHPSVPPIPPLPRVEARRPPARPPAAGRCRPPPPTGRAGAPPHPLRRVARSQARTPTVASPRRDRFKRGRGRPPPRLLSLPSPVCRGQAPTPAKQGVCTIDAAEVPCCAFAGVPPMPKLADAAAHLLLPTSPPAAASFLSLAHWSLASVSTGAERRHAVSPFFSVR